MKYGKSKKAAIALAIVGFAGLFSGCGSSPPPMTAPAPVAGIPGIGAAGCVPLTQPIGFSGTNVFFNSNTILAGIIPLVDPIAGGRQFGQVTAVTGGTGGPYTSNYTGPMGIPISIDGTISMNIVPTAPAPVAGTTPMPNAPYNGNMTAVNATGTITLSAQKQQMIMSSFGYGTGYNPYYPSGAPMPQQGATSLCANGVAISLTHDSFKLYGGRVYLYLNNPTAAQYPTAQMLGSGHGTYLQF